MFWHSLLTISLISSQRIWSLPFPGKWQASRDQLLETMDLRDIVRSVGPRHRAVVPGNQPKPDHHKIDSKFPENIGIPTEYHGQAIHFLQLELDASTGAHHDFGNVPLLQSPLGNGYDVLYGDTPLPEDMKMNHRRRQSDELEKMEKNNPNSGIINDITDIELRIQSGSPDKSPLVQVSSNAGEIWSLLPPGIVDVPGFEFTPEQMEEIAETGRLCTEDGECVYFSGGWGEACCPFG